MKTRPLALLLTFAISWVCAALTPPALAAPPSHRHRVRQGPPLLGPKKKVSRELPRLPVSSVTSLVEPIAERTLQARVLVISADGMEPGLSTIKQALDYAGTPYTLHIAVQNPGGITPQALAAGSHGHYQGIILTTSLLSYFDGVEWTSALSPAEWQALADYERAFSVRQVTWYTYPTPELGFGAPSVQDTSLTPLPLTPTPEGRAVFSYLGEGPVVVRMAYAYLAPPAPGTTPLLQDAHGRALAAVRTLPDGRENLALTFDGNAWLVHSVALAQGVLSWVTRGLYIGAHRVYVGAQVDDVFLDNDLWGLPEDETWRMAGSDLLATHQWQQRVQAQLSSPQLRLDMAFNGLGTVPGEYPGDTLTSTAKALSAHFKWLSHTYTHPYLDDMDYASVSQELSSNLAVAQQLDLANFSGPSLVTPNITGLSNPAAMQAAYDQGVRFVVSDTSIPGQDTRFPNAALRNFVVPQVLMIPRRPTNLFYNVSTPAQWVGEYNHLYRAFWGKDLSYEEILDKESEVLLLYMLKGELAPWMFHQANLRFYAPEHSLLTDLLDATFTKYKRLYNLPLLSPSMAALGQRAAQRLVLNETPVEGRITPGQSITLTASGNVTLPVTGMTASCPEYYGGQPTSYVQLQAGQSLTVGLTGAPPSGQQCPGAP